MLRSIKAFNCDTCSLKSDLLCSSSELQAVAASPSRELGLVFLLTILGVFTLQHPAFPKFWAAYKVCVL